MVDETSTPSLPLPKPAPAPAPAPSESKDHLAPAERAYFESRGEAPIPAPAATPSQDEPAQADSPAAAAPAPAEPSQTAPEDQAKANQQGALAEERKRRRDAEEHAKQLELQQARMDERFRMWQQATQQQRPQQPQQPISPDQDIFGAVHQVMQKQQETDQALNATRAALAQREAIEQLRQWAAQQETQFASQTPDYATALQHLKQSRFRELKAFGLSDGNAVAKLTEEEIQLIAYARQQNRNVGQMAYEFAQQRGYQPRKGTPGNGTAQLDRIQAGQQASRSLSGIGGNAGGGNQVTAEDLLKMPMKEFAAWTAKNPAKFRKLKGA